MVTASPQRMCRDQWLIAIIHYAVLLGHVVTVTQPGADLTARKWVLCLTPQWRLVDDYTRHEGGSTEVMGLAPNHCLTEGLSSALGVIITLLREPGPQAGVYALPMARLIAPPRLRLTRGYAHSINCLASENDCTEVPQRHRAHQGHCLHRVPCFAPPLQAFKVRF